MGNFYFPCIFSYFQIFYVSIKFTVLLIRFLYMFICLRLGNRNVPS